MITFIPNWALKRLRIIITMLRLLINVKVGGVGTSLPDTLQQVSCVIWEWLRFTNASQWLHSLTGFTHESHSWHRTAPRRKVPAGMSSVCISCLYLQTLIKAHHLHLLLYAFWHKHLLSLRCVHWFKYSSLTKKAELAVWIVEHLWLLRFHHFKFCANCDRQR